MFVPTFVLIIVINDQNHLQNAIETITLRRLWVIGRNGNMPNSPRNIRVVQSSRLNTAALSKIIDCGTPKDGKNLSYRQFFTTSDESS